MRNIKIGIDSNLLNGWGGGIDFIATLAEALQATDEVDTFLVIRESSMMDKILGNIIYYIKARGSLKRYRIIKKSLSPLNDEMIDVFKKCAPRTKVIRYKAIDNRFISNWQKKQEKCLKDNQIDIILPSARCDSLDFSIPRIGYIFDFQHKYLPYLFTQKDIEWREMYFERQVKNSKYILVNAETVKKDIDLFYPEHECKVFVLPFKPFQMPITTNAIDLYKYRLPQKYYVICNQFWMHKNHMLVFDALELLYNQGKRDLHLVCTGMLNDDRNLGFGSKIKEKINSLMCKNNIHLVGFVPKDDQVYIMKNAIGLVQPTLFEGGPGGGSVYNAICLGLTCLVSDIPVNREITGVDNIFYFDKDNPKELAELMVQHEKDIRKSGREIELMIKNNKREYSEELISIICRVLSNETDKKIRGI